MIDRFTRAGRDKAVRNDSTSVSPSYGTLGDAKNRRKPSRCCSISSWTRNVREIIGNDPNQGRGLRTGRVELTLRRFERPRALHQ